MYGEVVRLHATVGNHGAWREQVRYGDRLERINGISIGRSAAEVPLSLQPDS